MGGGATPKDPSAPKIESVSDQPQEDQDLAAFVKRKVEDVRATSNRISHEGIWMTNIAYILGFDSVYYDTSSRQYKSTAGPMRYPSRNRTHANQILPACQNRLARMCKNPPRWEIAPEDKTSEAKDAASRAYDVLLDLWNRLNLNDKRIDLGMWKQECGHSYMVGGYDDEGGDPIVDPATGEFEGFEGEVTAEVASAFEFFVDPKAKTLDEARHAVRAKVRDLSYFRDRYERGNLVKEEDAWLLSTQYELRINSLNSAGPSSGNNAQEQMKNAAIELSYYEKRTKKYPQGRHIIVANGVVLKNDVLFIGEFPFVKFDDIKVAGKFYSETPVTHARPLQDQYNRNLARTSEWCNKLIAGKWISARGHNLSQESLNDRTEVVQYDPVPLATEPHAMQVPTIPAYVFTERNDVKSELFQQFGLSEVSRGQLPAAGIPAVGMQLLVEQDETRIGIEIESDEHNWGKFGTILLKFANRGYKTERMLKKKQGDDYKFISYNGDDLPKQPDVQVIRGSTIPTSKSLRRQEILNAYGQGLLGNPGDPVVRQQTWGMLEFGDLPDAWKDWRLDMSQINDVIQQIQHDEVPTFNALDNHSLHIVQLNRFRKEKDAELNQDQKNMVEFLIDLHAQAMVGMANPQLVATLKNVRDGKMPDGSTIEQIMEAQERGANVMDLNDAAHQAQQTVNSTTSPPPPMPMPAGPQA